MSRILSKIQIGNTLSEALDVLKEEENISYRIFRPHDKNLLTDDYVVNRLNIYVDDTNTITSFNWG